MMQVYYVLFIEGLPYPRNTLIVTVETPSEAWQIVDVFRTRDEAAAAAHDIFRTSELIPDAGQEGRCS
jgi:hypothetical protein